MTGEPVLIVDDNATNLKLARVVLEGAGFDVRTARDADEADRVLATLRPRVILMDIQLPGRDGLTFTRLLKSDPASAGIAVIALTAYAMVGDEEKALAAGCDGYVTKPIDPDNLVAVVNRYLKASPREATD
jgi:CheY-like chemotaxis protein